MSEAMLKLHKAKKLIDDAMSEMLSDDELDKASQEEELEQSGAWAGKPIDEYLADSRKGRSPNPPVRLRDCKVDDFVTSLQQKKALVRLLNREIVAMAKQEDGDE